MQLKTIQIVNMDVINTFDSIICFDSSKVRITNVSVIERTISRQIYKRKWNTVETIEHTKIIKWIPQIDDCSLKIIIR